MERTERMGVIITRTPNQLQNWLLISRAVIMVSTGLPTGARKRRRGEGEGEGEDGSEEGGDDEVAADLTTGGDDSVCERRVTRRAGPGAASANPPEIWF